MKNNTDAEQITDELLTFMTWKSVLDYSDMKLLKIP